MTRTTAELAEVVREEIGKLELLTREAAAAKKWQTVRGYCDKILAAERSLDASRIGLEKAVRVIRYGGS